MYENFLDFFLSEPDRMVTTGDFMAQASGFVLLVGAVGHAATSAVAVAQSIGKHAAEPTVLATLYPSFPTWWVPETLVGCLPALLLLIAGVALASTGKKIKRIYF